MQKKILEILMCPKCKTDTLDLDTNYLADDSNIEEGLINCTNCNSSYPIIKGVPVFVEIEDRGEVFERTSNHYGSGWVEGDESASYSVDEKWHFDELIKLFGFPKNRKGFAIEAGSGNGKDTVRLSVNNPESEIITIDISDGIFVANKRFNILNLKNIHPIRASLDQIPIKDEVLDYGYSFGVLHHMPVPLDGMKEVSRTLKKGSSFLTYLYSDLSEKPFLYFFLKPITFLRKITHKFNIRILRIFCYLMMPPVFIFLVIPSRFFKSIGLSSFAKKIPHHHNKSFNSLFGELFDRFGAQIEFRYNPTTLNKLYSDANLKMTDYENLEIWRGWVSKATKN
jgi:uncharacterized protein YbaR (Trm112 family)|tara:strand:- start:50 stop:1066 length:1017 start_codon:yes stop_codon:yes gene_type:complete